MFATRRPLLAALALTAGPILTLAMAVPAGAATTPPPPTPQFVIHFSAVTQPPPDPTLGLAFHSTACVIGPPTHPLLVKCQENGHVVLSATGGSGSASLSSAFAGINWTFKLVRTSTATTTTYLMSGKGTESTGASPVLRPVRVTGRITVIPTPDPTAGPTIRGTEAVYPLPVSS